MKLFVGISAASGQIYAGRLLKALAADDHEVTVCFSSGAIEAIRAEDLALLDLAEAPREKVTDAFLKHHGLSSAGLKIAAPDDMSNAFASGSSLADAAIVCPCSMSSIGSMAAGITRNLIHRAADVMLKEGRPLVVVPRETPLSEIHLENMLRLKRAGALIVPAMPGFYHNPETIEQLVDFVVGKIMDLLGIDHDLFERWQGQA